MTLGDDPWEKFQPGKRYMERDTGKKGTVRADCDMRSGTFIGELDGDEPRFTLMDDCEVIEDAND